MTQDEIQHMWKVASNDPHHDTNWHDPVVMAFAKLVAAKEREACAEICMEIEQRFAELSNKFFFEFDTGGVLAASQCLNAIRARGEA